MLVETSLYGLYVIRNNNANNGVSFFQSYNPLTNSNKVCILVSSHNYAIYTQQNGDKHQPTDPLNVIKYVTIGSFDMIGCLTMSIKNLFRALRLASMNSLLAVKKQCIVNIKMRYMQILRHNLVHFHKI